MFAEHLFIILNLFLSTIASNKGLSEIYSTTMPRNKRKCARKSVIEKGTGDGSRIRSKTRDKRKKNVGGGAKSKESKSYKRQCPTKKRKDGEPYRNILSRAVKKEDCTSSEDCPDGISVTGSHWDTKTEEIAMYIHLHRNNTYNKVYENELSKGLLSFVYV